MLSCYY